MTPTRPGGRRINTAAFQLAANPPQGSLGRNAFSGFGMSQLDLALRREFPVGERRSLQLRIEAFNTFNHPNFADPVRFLSSPLFGQSGSMLNLMLGTGSPGSGRRAPCFRPAAQDPCKSPRASDFKWGGPLVRILVRSRPPGRLCRSTGMMIHNFGVRPTFRRTMPLAFTGPRFYHRSIDQQTNCNPRTAGRSDRSRPGSRAIPQAAQHSIHPLGRSPLRCHGLPQRPEVPRDASSRFARPRRGPLQERLCHYRALLAEPRLDPHRKVRSSAQDCRQQYRDSPRHPFLSAIVAESRVHHRLLRQWHMGNGGDDPQPGFDRWVSSAVRGPICPGPNGLQCRWQASAAARLHYRRADRLRARLARPSARTANPGSFICPTKPSMPTASPPSATRTSTPTPNSSPPPTMARDGDMARHRPMWVQNQRNSWHGVDFAYHGTRPLGDLISVTPRRSAPSTIPSAACSTPFASAASSIPPSLCTWVTTASPSASTASSTNAPPMTNRCASPCWRAVLNCSRAAVP